jgi:uncharacterized protein with GYD domain
VHLQYAKDWKVFWMLFMIVAKHTAETCPGGIMRPDKEFAAKLNKAMKKSGVKVVEGYLDAPGHVWYFFVETDDNTALNNAVEPLRLVGDVLIAPVLKFSEGVVWAKKIGIQK